MKSNTTSTKNTLKEQFEKSTKQRLGEELGAGGEGAVYLSNNGKNVFKIGPGIHLEDVKYQQNLKNNGINTPKISSYGTFKNTEGRDIPYIEMECIRGETLYDFLQSKSLTKQNLQNISVQIHDQCAKMKNKGHSHGDIGVENIIIDLNKKVWFIDVTKNGNNIDEDWEIIEGILNDAWNRLEPGTDIEKTTETTKIRSTHNQLQHVA